MANIYKYIINKNIEDFEGRLANEIDWNCSKS